MIVELVKALYEVVTSLNVAICHNININLDNSTNNLKLYLEQYKNTPQILYKEIFEPWCKVDVIRFYQLTNDLISKPEQWCEQSILIVPDIYTIAMTLCEIADEIEARLPDITTEKSEPPEEFQAVEEQITLPKEFDTDEARALLGEIVKQGFAERDGAVYRWKSTNALFGYMVSQLSERLDIRPDNDRLPWAIFQRAFKMSDAQIRTASNNQSRVNNRTVNEPTGYEKIKAICK